MKRPLFLATIVLPLTLAAQQQNGDWPSYHRDLAGTRYAPFDQISKANVAQLRTVWTWKPDTSDKPNDVRNESTPIVIGGTMYFTTGLDRTVVAVDATTGTTKWVHRYDEGPRKNVAPRRGSGRGVSWWKSGDEARIFVVTPGFQLVAIDAATGIRVPSFGSGGVVDLKLQLGVPVNPDSARIGNSSPPVVFEDIVVIGPALEVGLQPRSRRNVPGRIVAIDARTGALRWRFNTIPQPGEFGNETWKGNSWEYTGNAGAWAPMSVDTRRGYLYMPVEAATGDVYGGHRPGDNLFSTSLVCLDIRTGKRVWHYQLVHHDIWDLDVPTAPILADVRVDGRRVEAVVQLTKQSFAYVLDRITGKPVWPIIEQPVPASDVPGEVASSTQPIPSRPAPFDRQGITTDDLIDFTPALRAQALEAVKPFRLGRLFQPSSLDNAPDGTKGTLNLPGTVGGANWEHGAFDTETGVLYVGSHTNPANYALRNDPKRSDMNYILGGDEVPTVRGLPLIKPPWSRVTAIDLNTGDHKWMVPNGDTPDRVKQNPALAGLTIPPTGGFSRPMILATKSLLFVGEGYPGAPKFRALDKSTGATVWVTTMPGATTSQPMTYLQGGRQFVAVWVSVPTRRPGTELVVMALGNP